MLGLSKQEVNQAIELARNDFKQKFHGSTLGHVWSILTPLILFGILYVVFSVFMDFDMENYQLYLLLGVIIFSFFSEATRDGMHSIHQKKSIVKDLKFPKHIIVISSVITSAVYLFINLFIFLLLMSLFGIFPGLTSFYLIVTLVELFLLVLGLGFLLSAVYVRHGDMEYIWEFLVTIFFWITPIFYDYDMVGSQYVKYYMLNPLARIISTARQILIYDHIPLLHGASGWKHEIITLLICVFIFVWGVWLFRKKSPRFAEML